MRTPLASCLLLAALALQPALAGGWGRHDERRAPPPPQYRQPYPQQYRPPEPPRLLPLFGPPRAQYPAALSRDEAMRRAQQVNGGGRILAADPAQGGFLVRVLKDGEVRSVFVPGQ